MPETFHAGPGLGRLSDVTVIHGDCLEAMAELAADSVDAIVTDPPYGLSNTDPDHVIEALTHWLAGDRTFVPNTGGGFMGKAWDSFVPPPAVWDECYRVLKPGGHLLSFAGTRTIGLMETSIRLARFDIRDSIAWLYGSGFPKSLDVSKAIDKAAGVTREVVGTNERLARYMPNGNTGSFLLGGCQSVDELKAIVADGGRTPNGEDAATVLARKETADSRFLDTAPATPEAAQWSGWGTALKPAFEPVVVARKPLGKGTVAANVLAHGTGALNIDACRVHAEDVAGPRKRHGGGIIGAGSSYELPDSRGEQPPGRWPANVVLDADQAAALDEQSGTLTTGGGRRNGAKEAGIYGAYAAGEIERTFAANSGGASRFFKVVSSTMETWEQPGEKSIRDASTSVGKSQVSTDSGLRTDGSGSPSMDPSLQDSTSITETTTRSTTTSPTCSCSQPANIRTTTDATARTTSTSTESSTDAASAALSTDLCKSSQCARLGLDRGTASLASASTFESGADETASTLTNTCEPIDSEMLTRFRYVAKAPKKERPVVWRKSCNCETIKPCQEVSPTTDTVDSRSDVDRSSSTSSFGSKPTADQSPQVTTSTIETATSSTTTSATFNSSPSSSTSGFTQAVNSETMNGGSLAVSVESSSQLQTSTGISPEKDGRSTDAVDPATSLGWSSTSVCANCGAPAKSEGHSTVKPLALMRWLVRLVTPPGGTILDPFAGSGTTVEAALIEGFQVIGIEREADYLPMIQQRIARVV